MRNPERKGPPPLPEQIKNSQILSEEEADNKDGMPVKVEYGEEGKPEEIKSPVVKEGTPPLYRKVDDEDIVSEEEDKRAA
ncbi:MAG: hypothetical protein COU51_03810 [Parcubacteria group bacterium CG10_big_fil_rev_8_21_14_0_10_36_14]|nr:MAG: hypothetical protein COU51_03810 [Parcubacteria group bacterium CG10_big_fil_rev_8_21_14_0_10_36_14]